MTDLDFICDGCLNKTDTWQGDCQNSNCLSRSFSQFSKGDISCSSCNVLIEDGYSCKEHDKCIYCNHCDY